MSAITAIGTNHSKILTGLKDKKKLHIKLAESKAKKWNDMAQVLQDVAEMAISFERSREFPCHPLRSTRQQPTTAKTPIATNITEPTNCM